MKRKVLLMGRAGSGKTSMRSIIFDNVVAGQTKNYINTKVTMEIETAQIRFLGDLQLDLWDCGGQESYMDQYLESQKEKVFRNVQTLIYIFDITSTAATDMVYFVDILSALRAGSGPGESNGSNEAGPKLHVLIHKMDLIENNGGQPTYDAKAAEIRSKCAAAGWNEPSLYATSIFNESLYSAWSDIVSTLNPHVAKLGTHLSRFASLIHASEVVLFERTTMLVIGQSGHDSNNNQISDHSQSPTSNVSSPSHALVNSSRPHDHPSEWPEDRFAKISQAIKIFRLACGRLKSEFETMEVKQQTYTLLFDSFTPKTYVLVISTHQELSDLARIKQAIAKAKPVFAELPGVSLAGR